MRENKLIFSDRRSDRIKRHLLFWGIWYFYIAITHAAAPVHPAEIAYFKNPVYTFTEAFFIVLAQVPVTYAMIYLVLPKFILKEKYILAVFATLFVWFCAGVINLFLMSRLQQIAALILPPESLPTTKREAGTNFFMAVIATNKGAFTMSASALMLKFVKYWYLKEQRNLQLMKENTEAQLQLLTAQVHPHFLFNTLNNIYSQAQEQSPKSATLIMGLSDILRYVLYEGRKPLVPLKLELAMIREYISLEKVRYGNKLDVHVLTPDKTDNIYIAPLMLLPFVENCFKHGTSKMLQNPWINLTVELQDLTLVMKLMNGKAAFSEASPGKSGIGISNARQRLDLLYKENYELKIRDDEEVFVVDLKMNLVRMKDKMQPETPETAATLTYEPYTN